MLLEMHENRGLEPSCPSNSHLRDRDDVHRIMLSNVWRERSILNHVNFQINNDAIGMATDMLKRIGREQFDRLQTAFRDLGLMFRRPSAQNLRHSIFSRAIHFS